MTITDNFSKLKGKRKEKVFLVKRREGRKGEKRGGRNSKKGRIKENKYVKNKHKTNDSQQCNNGGTVVIHAWDLCEALLMFNKQSLEYIDKLVSIRNPTHKHFCTTSSVQWRERETHKGGK